MLSAPLRQLSAERIGPYAGWAMTSVGDAGTYRYFLPRILELSIREPAWLGFEPMIIASRLIDANWRDWAVDQQAAISDFFHAAFAVSRVQHAQEDERAALWLAALLRLGEPLLPLFEAWRAGSSPNAALQIALLVQREGKNLFRHGEVRGPFWEDVEPRSRRELAQLLQSDATRALLRNLLTHAAEGDRWLAESALAELERKF